MRTGLLTTKDTKSTKVNSKNIQILRVLRVLRGENEFLRLPEINGEMTYAEP